jgi:hypothetical protein
MTFQPLRYLGLLAVCLSAAAGELNLQRVSSADAGRAAQETHQTDAAMWLWSDKYVYQPGEQLTLRWTVKTNDDLYPFTIVAYRQNNQTGKKTFMPKATEEATDIFGNTVAAGFQPTRLANTEKAVLIGEGGLFSPAVGTIPDEPGMHTLVVQLRDYTGTAVIKTAYMKIGVVSGFEDISGNIESNTTWVNTKAYRLSGVVSVKNGATLTIEPGTFVIGQPGTQPPSVLIVTSAGRIMAEGTRSRPIVMTSSLPFGQRTRGDWGGLIMLGKAPINVGANAGGRPNTAGEFFIEGLPAADETKYGGTDASHDCGSLRYVRVEYAGSIFAPNNESNSFTWGGCGSKSKAEYLQAIYGLDDSFEWFGGNNNAKYLVGGLGADDYIDFQLGYTGKVQFGIFYQNQDSKGNRGLEGDNSEFNQSATPLSSPQMFNLTFVGSGTSGFDETSSPGLFLRRGAAGSFNNILLTNFFSTGVFVDGATTQAQIDNGNLKMNGILLWNNGLGTKAPNTVEGQVDAGVTTFAQGARGEGKNFVAADHKMRRPFEWSDPDWRAMFNSPILRATWVQPPDNGFFDQGAHFIGGVGDVAWWEEWTSFLQDNDIKQ